MPIVEAIALGSLALATASDVEEGLYPPQTYWVVGTEENEVVIGKYTVTHEPKRWYAHEEGLHVHRDYDVLSAHLRAFFSAHYDGWFEQPTVEKRRQQGRPEIDPSRDWPEGLMEWDAIVKGGELAYAPHTEVEVRSPRPSDATVALLGRQRWLVVTADPRDPAYIVVRDAQTPQQAAATATGLWMEEQRSPRKQFITAPRRLVRAVFWGGEIISFNS